MAKTTKAQTTRTAATAKKQVAAKTSPEESTSASQAETLDVSGARKAFLAAQEKLTAHEPSKALRARFEAQIDKASAIAVGVRIASDVVLYDAMTDLPLVLGAVLAGKVPGFGPKEAHYALSIALALETAWRSFHDRQVQRAGVSNTKTLTLEAAREERAALFELVESVVAPGSSANASLLKAASFGGKTLRTVAQGLDAVVKVARDLLKAAASDPSLAELLADKGLTETVVNNAAAFSARLSEAATGHAEARSEVDAGQGEIDELDGRLRDELVRLRRAVQRARRNGVTVPEVGLANVRRLYRTPRTPAPPPAPIPAPPTA